MAALEPVLVVTDASAGLDEQTKEAVIVSSITPVSSVGSILAPPPAQPSPTGDGTPSTVAGTIGNVTDFSITWRLGQPEDISYSVVGTQDEIDTLTPGRAPGACRIVAPSLDGGARADSRLLSTGSQLEYDYPLAATESGGHNGLGSVLGTATIRRWTALQVSLADAINGAAGQIKTQTTPTDTLCGDTLPTLAGIASTPIGLPGSRQGPLLKFTYKVDASVGPLTLDLDINRDSPLRALETICERMGGLADPQRSQFVIDSGDFGLDGKTSQSVWVGALGGAAHMAFDESNITTIGSDFLERGTKAQAQTRDMCASCSFTGGQTHHGMPDGARITAVRTVNHEAADATGNYRSGMPVLGLYINRDQGGVYYWPGDGALHPFPDKNSPSMGVTDLWYDETANTLYAATDAGVYSHSSDPNDSQPWVRLGAMALKVYKLCKDGGSLYALVEFQTTGIRHVAVNDGSASKIGLGGWRSLTSVDVEDFAVAGGYLYYYTTTNKTILWRQSLTSAAQVPIAIPGGGAYVATGLDPVTDQDAGATVTGIFVRTSGGGAQLQYLGAGHVTMTYAGGGLVDALGSPVFVNRITQHGAGSVQWDGRPARAVVLWAATNRGVFATANSQGGGWLRTSGQSNLGDLEVSMVASAPPRKWLGRTLTRVYAISDRALYVSHNGTVNWIDAFAKPLDAGPTFYDLWKVSYGVYPDNVATTLPLTAGDGGTYHLVRALTEATCEYDYTLYNYGSTAPAGAHRSAELPEISTPSFVPEVKSSGVLLGGMVRFLGYTSGEQEIMTVESVFEDDGDKLRTLRPTHLVTLTAVLDDCRGEDTVVYAAYDKEPFYVLEHTIKVSGNEPGIARTTTRLGKLLLDDRTDPSRVTADLGYALSRQTLYSNSHRT